MRAIPLPTGRDFSSSMEKAMWLAGRFLQFIPSRMRIRVPFGINRGMRWLRGSANAPEWLGIYEYRKQRILPSLVRKGETVCDIGANAGFYALALSRLVGSGSVIAFEPLPNNVDKLQEHVSLNGLTNVTVAGCAVCEKSGFVPFAIGQDDFTGRISEADRNTFEVPGISLDEYLERNALSDPSFLKIDVEGAEAGVLAGARRLIERAHPRMLIALHGRAAATECYRILRDADYNLFGLDRSKVETDSIPPEIIAIYSSPNEAASAAKPARDGLRQHLANIPYRIGISLLRLANNSFLTRPLEIFCRIWQRHAKLRTHLRAFDFDGVIDGGANVGEFAAIVRDALPAADLVCVEPHPGSAATLRKAGYNVVEAALWKEPGELQLQQPTERSTSCTVKGESTSNEKVPMWEVPAVRLDSLNVTGDRLLVKLDLQGAEIEALKGMDALWERCAGVLLEVSIGPTGNCEALRQMLTERGFQEYSTTNELVVGGRVVEADKLWVRAGV
jgi:FkbM family methyltransferase